jgi:outer membrane protein assembly factor BamB
VKWTYTIPEVNKSVCGISVANGVVYFGTYGSGTWTGALYALDANTGSVKWKTTSYIDVQMLGVANGIVYAEVNGGGWGLVAFDANTGVFKWNGLNYVDLSISNGLVFGGSGSLDVLDAKTGVLKWSYNDSSTYSVIGPFIYNGNVYFCENGNLYCLGQ